MKDILSARLEPRAFSADAWSELLLHALSERSLKRGSWKSGQQFVDHLDARWWDTTSSTRWWPNLAQSDSHEGGKAGRSLIFSSRPPAFMFKSGHPPLRSPVQMVLYAAEGAPLG
ncbi:MAG TPA: hypothetical protein VL242_24280 [Sorangium sp.]|nr:hypothetical protein [Sorangium sp.]